MRGRVSSVAATLLAAGLSGCIPETPMQAQLWVEANVAPSGTTTREFRLAFATHRDRDADGAAVDVGAPRAIDVAIDVPAGVFEYEPTFPEDRLDVEVFVDGTSTTTQQLPVARSLSVTDGDAVPIHLHLACDPADPPCEHELEIRVTPTLHAPVPQVSLTYELVASYTLTNRRGESEGTEATWTIVAP